MAFFNSPNIVTTGLVLAWDAANPKSYPGSGTTIYDLSGNGNHGTLNNGVGFSTNYKGILTFDGTNDYVKSTSVNGTGIMNPTLYGEVISVNIWIQSTSTQSSQYVITTGAYTGTVTGFVFIINDVINIMI